MIPGITGRVEAALSGWPEQALTALLVGLGLGLILVGVFGTSNIVKAVLAAWVLLP
jgi:hypothetical protein